MPGLHARSTSTCTPDVSALRPRTPNNDTLRTDFSPTTPQWPISSPMSPAPQDHHHHDHAPQSPQLLETLVWQVPQSFSKEYDHQVEEPLLEWKDRPMMVPLLRTPSMLLKRRENLILATLWIASIVLTSMLTYLGTKRYEARIVTTTPEMKLTTLGSLKDGYATDLEGPREAIRVRKQQFTGSLDFKDRHGFIPIGSPSQKYVGAGPEIDAAWDELTKDRYFLLSDDEARKAYGDDDDDLSRYWNVHHGGYIAGLDVLHTLHCLNHLRMGLYPDRYPQDPQHSTMHKAHCVDHLRQLAMCNSDLTPVPTQWFAGLNRNYINSSQVHTCRDFSLIRDWATERFNGSTAVKPRNKDGSPREEFYAPWTP